MHDSFLNIIHKKLAHSERSLCAPVTELAAVHDYPHPPVDGLIKCQFTTPRLESNPLLKSLAVDLKVFLKVSDRKTREREKQMKGTLAL